MINQSLLNGPLGKPEPIPASVIMILNHVLVVQTHNNIIGWNWMSFPRWQSYNNQLILGPRRAEFIVRNMKIYLHFLSLLNAIGSRYFTVIYNTIVHTAKLLQWQKLGQILHSWMTLHTSPLQKNYGVSFVSCSIQRKMTVIYRECIVLRWHR